MNWLALDFFQLSSGRIAAVVRCSFKAAWERCVYADGGGPTDLGVKDLTPRTQPMMFVSKLGSPPNQKTEINCQL